MPAPPCRPAAVAADGLGARALAQGRGTKGKQEAIVRKILLRWEHSFSINNGSKDFVLQFLFILFSHAKVLLRVFTPF